MRFLLFLLFFYSNFIFADWPSSGLMYNDDTDKKIAIGVFPQGHLNVSEGNIVTNASATGLAAKHADGNWKDATSPGCLCEGWSAGAVSGRDGRQYHGDASIHNGGTQNITVKSFVVDTTSIESIVTVKNDSGGHDRPGQDMLEVKHVYSPSKLASDQLFEVNVTMTNVSGNTLTDVRYNRTMDWDIPPTEFREVVTIVGAEESAASDSKPRVYASGNNGFRDPNVFGSKSTGWSGYSKSPHTGINHNAHRMGPSDHGFSATFEFDDLLCGEAHNFKTYYGSATTRELMIEAFEAEDIPLYSIGEQSGRTGVVYGFGFKGVSGTALAPTLPEKSAVLPGGVSTDEDRPQTYAAPLVHTIDGTKYVFQAVFNYRNDHQWEGDILRYTLDSNGDFIPGSIPVSAAEILEAKIDDGNYENHYDDADSGRNIWTVGQIKECPGGASGSFNIGANTGGSVATYGRGFDFSGEHDKYGDPRRIFDLNNFKTSNKSTLEKFLYNCNTGSSEEDLIRFVRGYDIWNEDGVAGARRVGNIRKSLIADTFHSNLLYVGPPVDSVESTNVRSETYFRKHHGYEAFKDKYVARSGRIYVGANDGMLHAFDKDLNLRWSFIPPMILPKLRSLIGSPPSGGTAGTSNSKFLLDGPIIVKDIYDPHWDDDGNKWRTILIGSLGWGGKGFYMLDITDELNPQFMGAIENDDKNNRVLKWNNGGVRTVHKYGTGSDIMGLTDEEYPYQYLGYTWSKPSIALLPYAQQESDPKFRQRYALVFGAGYASGLAVNQGNYVIVADVVGRLNTSTSSSDAVDTSAYKHFGPFDALSWKEVPKDAASDANQGVTAAMSVITPDKMSDTESDYYGGIAYFPDLHGQLWKYNLTRKELVPPGSTQYQHYDTVSTAATSHGDDSMHQLNKLWRSETTVLNDRYGSHQVASTLIENPSGKNVYNFFGTGDQSHIQTRYSTIDNWIIGTRDIDFPDTELALTGTDKTKDSSGIFRWNISPGSGTSCSSTDVPGWYTKLTDRYGTSLPARVTGRISIKGGALYTPIYQPEDSHCPVYGTAEVLVMTNSCQGAVTSINAGTGLSTSITEDSEGNLYIGVSNKEDGIGSGFSATKRIDNLIKIGEAGTDASSSNPARGIRIKSWRELFN